MVRSRIFATAMAAVIGLAGTKGIAHAANDRVGEEAEDGKEITALLNAKTSLAQAIAAAAFGKVRGGGGGRSRGRGRSPDVGERSARATAA